MILAYLIIGVLGVSVLCTTLFVAFLMCLAMEEDDLDEYIRRR